MKSKPRSKRKIEDCSGAVISPIHELHLFQIEKRKNLKLMKYNFQSLKQLCLISTATSVKTQQVHLSLQQFNARKTNKTEKYINGRKVSQCGDRLTNNRLLSIFYNRLVPFFIY